MPDAPGNYPRCTGSCPICGMALEPVTVSLDDEENPELVDMNRRFWVCLVLTIRSASPRNELQFCIRDRQRVTLAKRADLALIKTNDDRVAGHRRRRTSRRTLRR